MKTIKVLLLFPFIFTLGCESKVDELQPEKFIAVDQGKSLSTEPVSVSEHHWSQAGLQSNMRLQAQSLLLNYKDPLTINVRGQFLNEDSLLSVNAYTSSLQTIDGTRLEFIPDASGDKLNVFLFTKDYPMFKFCEIQAALANNGTFELVIQWSYEINFGPSITIWNLYYDGRNKRKKNYTLLNSLNADCSTQTSHVFIDHFGSGRLWGLELYQTRLQNIIRTQNYEL